MFGLGSIGSTCSNVGSICSSVCDWGTSAIQSVSHGISSIGNNLRFTCLTRTVLQKPLRAFVATASTASIIASSIFLKRAMQEEEPDPNVLTAYSLNLGVSIRLLLESLSPSLKGTKMRAVQDTLARWAYESYEVMLQLMNNFPEAEPELLNALMVIIGHHVTGDVLTLYYSQGQPLLENYRHSNYINLDELNLNADVHPDRIVSHLLQPDCDHLRSIIVFNVACSVVGAVSVVFIDFNLIERKGLTPFFEAAGYFLIGQGVGYLSMEGLRQCLKKLGEYGSNSFIVKFLNKFFQFAPALAVEIIAVIPSSHTGIFALIGGLYGMRNNEIQRRFQVLTPNAYEDAIRENQTVNTLGQRVKNLAIKIDEYASLAFFAAFTGWFAYGAHGNILREKVSLGLLIGSTLGSAVVAKVADMCFWPGQKGRAFNQLNYTLFDNYLFISVAYMFMKQMTAISSQAINQDTTLQLAFGDIGLVLFGISLGSGRLYNLRLVRGSDVLTTPGFRMLSLEAILYRSK